MKALSPSDLTAIEAAVRAAEARTTGEIYCIVTEESAHYTEVVIAWATVVALLGPAVLLLAGVHVTIP
ncbi:MAG: TPM domain-containing protein, partial [Phenylobacterium sp.]